MKIATHNPKAVEKGDLVAIERLDTDADEEVIVAEATGRDGPFVTTNIPHEHTEIMYDLLGIDAEDRTPVDEAQRWMDRYRNSNYQLFMRAKVNSSGGIEVDGV